MHNSNTQILTTVKKHQASVFYWAFHFGEKTWVFKTPN